MRREKRILESNINIFLLSIHHNFPLQALAQHPAATSSQHGACVEIEFADARLCFIL